MRPKPQCRAKVFTTCELIILGVEGGLGLVKFWKRVPKKVHSDGYFCQKFLQQTKYFVHKQLIFCVWTAYILHKQNIFCNNSMFLAKTKYFVYKQACFLKKQNILYINSIFPAQTKNCEQAPYSLHKQHVNSISCTNTNVLCISSKYLAQRKYFVHKQHICFWWINYV